MFVQYRDISTQLQTNCFYDHIHLYSPHFHQSSKRIITTCYLQRKALIVSTLNSKWNPKTMANGVKMPRWLPQHINLGVYSWGEQWQYDKKHGHYINGKIYIAEHYHILPACRCVVLSIKLRPVINQCWIPADILLIPEMRFDPTIPK